jgi:NADH-quinone oxidoreductase subunit J
MIDTLLGVFFAASALAGALLMLVLRHPMRVALALVATMLSLAGVYAMIGAHAIAIFQVLVYVGAVMVFMVYVIMLLDVREPAFARRFSTWALPGGAVFLGPALVLGTTVWRSLGAAGPGPGYGVQAFSIDFLHDYWLHFEVVSVLLVAAVVAALAVVEVGRRARRG